MARRGAALTLGLVTARSQVWHTGSPQRIILGIYFLAAGAFQGVVEVMEVKLLIKWAPLMQTYIGRGLFDIFWGILVAAVGGVAWVIFGIIMIVFGFLLIFIPPCVIKDYHLGPYYLNGTARHSIDILNAEGASIDQVKDAWAKEKKRADSAEARFTKAEKDLAEARAELTLAETRGAEKA